MLKEADKEQQKVVEEEGQNDELESELVEDDAEKEQPAEPENEEDESESDDDELLLSFNGEEPEEKEEEPAPSWVRELRKSHKTTQKENKELKRKLEELEKPKAKPQELRKKPTLEDHDYDSDEFEKSLEDWFEEKRKHEDAKRQEQEAQDAQNESWKQKLSNYESAKSELKVKDFTEAEDEVLDNLSQVQQGIIVQGADNPALVVYALGKNPEKIKALASEKDPVKFAFAVAKLEKDLKMVKRSKKAPDPERRVKGSAPSGAMDSTLEKLRDEAAKTGDMSKVIAYKRSKQK